MRFVLDFNEEEESLELALTHIANLVEQGYHSGIDPNWHLELDDECKCEQYKNAFNKIEAEVEKKSDIYDGNRIWNEAEVRKRFETIRKIVRGVKE